MKLLLAWSPTADQLAALRAAADGGEIVAVQGRDDVLAQIADAEAYVPGPWDAEILQAGGRLRWVHFRWAGIEGSLFPAAVESYVTITNSAGVFNIPIAEHVLALMLALSRNIHLAVRLGLEAKERNAGFRAEMRGDIAELHGATLGIIGYGGIGRATAERARAFGMRILALRRRPTGDDAVAEAVWGMERLDDLLRESDYLLISAALTSATRGLIGARELALMKPSAVIINVARGAIIDEPALLDALRERRIRAAGLDVTAQEPLPADHPFWSMENVIITPHYAGWSPSTPGRQFALLLDNLKRYASGRPLLNVVDKSEGY